MVQYISLIINIYIHYKGGLANQQTNKQTTKKNKKPNVSISWIRSHQSMGRREKKHSIHAIQTVGIRSDQCECPGELMLNVDTHTKKRKQTNKLPS